MTEVINEWLFAERSLGLLSLAFGILATLLSIVGLYGVMSYSVARRYREIGIRMALGARPGLVLRMVLSESALLGLAGVACALPVVFAAGGLIRSELCRNCSERSLGLASLRGSPARRDALRRLPASAPLGGAHRSSNRAAVGMIR